MKILVDIGTGGQTLCNGSRRADFPQPIQQIGERLIALLKHQGYQTLYSEDLPELNAEECGGRPALCAAIARRWGADCVLRLCVRYGETPILGCATATVHKGDRRAKALAERLLRWIEVGSDLDRGEIRTASNVLLLRRTPCPAVILVLQLPFARMDRFCEADADLYAHCIARGLAERM